MKTPSEPRADGHRVKHKKPSFKQPGGRRPAEMKATRAKLPAQIAKPGKVAPPPMRSKLQLPIVNNVNNAKATGTFDCAQCGLCCTYLAIEIDGPTTVKRATELLWYLYHEHVSLYVNDDAWMVQFETTCRYLTADRRCGVYATRPHICREFSEQDCEVNTGDGDGQTFYTVAAFMEYLKQAKPRVYALVMKGYAPPEEAKRDLHPFERRLRDVYVRRAAALSQPAPEFEPSSQPTAAPRTPLPLKKSRGSSASTDTL
jgi:Fe-S-cluster containining protein